MTISRFNLWGAAAKMGGHNLYTTRTQPVHTAAHANWVAQALTFDAGMSKRAQGLGA